MERLDLAQAQAIKKLSTPRLVGKLIRVGYSDEASEAMDRDAMLAAWAVCVADGKDKPEQWTQAPVIGYGVKLERKRLEIEERKLKLKGEKLAAERAYKVSVVNLAKRYGDAMGVF